MRETFAPKTPEEGRAPDLLIDPHADGSTSVNTRNSLCTRAEAAETGAFADQLQNSLLAAINADPDVAVMVMSLTGEIVAYTSNAPQVFGADENRDYKGLYLADVFDQKFADERLGWFQQVLRHDRPMRFRHIYQGDQMVTTIMPLDRDTEPPLLSVFTRRDRRHRHPGGESEYLDIEPLKSLSARELEVMVLIGHGFSVPETGKILHRSARTIEQHKANLGRKLGGSSVSNISRLVGHFGLQIEDLQLSRIQALRREFRTTDESAPG